MARELSDINTSGELADIKLDNTGTDDSVTKKDYVDAGLATKVEASGAASIIFTPQTPAPAPAEGKVFYDEATKTLAYYTDLTDVVLNIGQEMWARVLNNSGATIPNGTVVYENGASGGLPTIGLADTSEFTKANVLGLVTADIADGAEGLVTIIGVLRDVDTSAFTAGDNVFLSDTPGEFGLLDNNTGDYVTSLGMVLTSDVSGNLLVRVTNNITVPILIASLSGKVDPITPSITYQTLGGYTNYDNKVMTADPVTGEMTIFRGGFYRANFSATAEIISTNQTREIFFKVVNTTTGAEFVYGVPVARDVTVMSVSFSVPFVAATGDVQVVQYSSPDTFVALIFDSVSFSIDSVNLT